MAIGDKVTLSKPTVGGSNNTWGTENNALWDIASEILYAAREDRNNVVMGGGKIAWDGSSLTFTVALDIINHITAFKNSITTAASPIAINASGKVAYVQIVRKPASNNSITSATVVAAGSLPNSLNEGDFGTFVIAYRTADGTLIFPWLRKELLSGDHFQIGTGLTFFEKIAARGVSFKATVSDTSQLVVPGSATAPAAVWIDGKLYANVSNATMDLDTAGRSGLDTGSKAANTPYYLYAIPASSGRTFDLVASVTAPSTGPTGFSSFVYLGVFPTVGSSQIDHFFYSASDLSYFKMKATNQKPSYESVTDSSQVKVPASKNKPACVIIDGDVYINVEDETLDMDTSGRGGIDTGAKAANSAYYIYAIPALTGIGFDLVFSLSNPSTGPTGFSSWSYIGAFATDSGSAVIQPFKSGNGVYISDETFETETHTGNTSSNAETFASLPSTAKSAYIHFVLDPSAANQTGRCTGISSTTNDGIGQFGQVAGQPIRNHGWVPLFTAQTLYLQVSNAAATATANLMGWIENPGEWR